MTIDYLTLLCIPFNLNGTSYFSEPGLVGNDRDVLHFAVKHSLLIVEFCLWAQLFSLCNKCNSHCTVSWTPWKFFDVV